MAIDSSAPAPPSRWPVIDLVLVTTTSVGVLAERRVDHQALGDVALRGRGGVRVDVHDVGGARCPTSAQRPHDRPGAAAAGRVGLGDVVGVGGDAGAEHLGVDPSRRGPGRAPRTRAPARRRPRRARSRRGRCPTAARRVVGSPCVLRQRHHVGERRHRQRVDRRLGAAGQRRRRRGRAGSGRAPARSPRCRRRRPRPGVLHRGPGADVQADVARPGRSASASGRRAARPGAGPSP